jgi:guanylate cyclase
LNQRETEINLEVRSSLIMFIDIEHFIEYSSTLTPSQIMSTLSRVFGSYDTLLQKYPLITKIKIIGDDYMCGSGLFFNEEDGDNHAIEIVSFGLECLQSIEEINQTFDTIFKVRIDNNNGSVIIYGVL